MSDQAFEACLAFARDLIRIPSLPGEEGAAAQRTEAEMRALNFDEVNIDAAGNVIGRIYGRDRARSVLLNAHLDHVSVSEDEAWPHPPFAAEIADGRVWGRGSADLKASVAVQVHAAAAARRAGVPACDIVVAAVVMEEVGGLGTLQLVEDNHFDLAFVGEPSHNELRNGNRGRFEFLATLSGQACHASAPDEGVNPNAALPALLEGLFAYETPESPDFGRSTCTPTRINTDQDSTNVVPSRVSVSIDYRANPSEASEAVRAQLEAYLRARLPDGIGFELSEVAERLRSWRGLERDITRGMPAFFMPADDKRLLACQRLLQEVYDRPVPIRPWRFTTDGGHMAAAGIPTIGFSPCEEPVIHTAQESVSLAMMREGLAGYSALLQRLDEII